MKYDAIIIGGGAAGLFCAIQAGKRGMKVVVIEHNSEVGRKILISGGGRCNFTNIHTTAENFISQNPHFCKSALSRFTPQDFLDLVKRYKIDHYEKKLGQMFCRESSRAIVQMLLDECRDARVEIRTGCSVSEVRKNIDFQVITNRGEFVASKVVVACGGLSFAKIGATDLGYRIARQFGLKIVETRPSLVALVLEGESFKQLAGVTVDTVVSTGQQSFRENILFTHRGLSGPAILPISNYWQRATPVTIDLLPDIGAAELLNSGRDDKQNLSNYLAGYLPHRFAADFARRRSVDRPISQISRKDADMIGSTLNNWTIKFRETEGYDRAEVTIGGVSTAELSSQTMEANKEPGLFFIGEVVDVTGWLGGYNFQWAWASAHAAAQAL